MYIKCNKKEIWSVIDDWKPESVTEASVHSNKYLFNLALPA